MTTSTRWIILITGAVLGAALVGGCSGEQSSSAPEIIPKTFALTPSNPVLATALLKGGLTGLQVFERVEKDTGRVVVAPRLQGKLKLRNTSPDRAVRLLSGRVEYVDAAGRLIPLAKDREDTTFTFYSYGADRLDPGMETTFDVDVPFPSSELTASSLADVRLAMTYTEIPYRREAVIIPLSLAAPSAASE